MAAATNIHFKIKTTKDETFQLGSAVTLSACLSPEISAVDMEIRWFKETDCVCLYKNRQVTEGRGYEGKVSLFTQEMETGNVSLRLSNCRESDIGHYLCQVTDEDRTEELTVRVWWCSVPSFSRLFEGRGTPYICIQQRARKWTEHERIKMENSALLTTYHTDVQSLINDREKKCRIQETTAQELKVTKLKIIQISEELWHKNAQIQEMMNVVEQQKTQLAQKDKELEQKNILLIEIKERTKQLEDTILEKSIKQLQESTNPDASVPIKRNKEVIKETPKSIVQEYITKRRSKDGMPPIMSQEQSTLHSPVPVAQLRLVMLGMSGSEKSAAVNTILGREERSQVSTSTVRQQSESRQEEVAGRQVTVVDTPDWFCPELSLGEVREDVGLCVRLSAPGPHAFLLVLPVKHSAGEEKAMVEKLEEIFGERFWRNTMIIITVTDADQENTEEFIRSGKQKVETLAEKCENRVHCLNIKKNQDGFQVLELLEKIDKMLGRSSEAFYSSELYLEIESQIKEMERKISKEREEKRVTEESEMMKKLEKDVHDTVRKMHENIQIHEEHIRTLDRRITEIENKIKVEADDNQKKQLERELKQNVQQKVQMENTINALIEKGERERKVMEECHRQEMEKVVEKYEGQARLEAERNLMKIILPELQRNIFISKSKMQEEFSRQMEEKDRELKTLTQRLSELSETHSLRKEVYQSAVMKITETERKGQAAQEKGESKEVLKWLFRKKEQSD